MTPNFTSGTTRDITLADRTFAVPLLPLRHNRVIYPLCRDLTGNPDDADNFIERLVKATGAPGIVRDDEWDKLIEIAFHAACAADKDLTRAAFDDLPIKPQELIDAFFAVRYQTGVWLAPESDASTTGDDGAGEAVTMEAGAG